MADEGYITQAEADEAKEKPIVTRGQPTAGGRSRRSSSRRSAKHLEQKYGAKALYEGGLSVKTTLDCDAAAGGEPRARARPARRRQAARRYRRDAARTSSREGRSDRRRSATIAGSRPMAAGDIVPGWSSRPSRARQRADPDRRSGRRASRARRSPGRGARPPPALFKAGDLIDVGVSEIDEAPGARIEAASLEQTPVVEGALVAIDNRTGQIRAMVGGFELRPQQVQPGDAGAPAARLDSSSRSSTPPRSIAASRRRRSRRRAGQPTAGPGQPPYKPQNYDHKFEGRVTLRHALEDSRNIPAVKMMEALGPKKVVAYAKRFGLRGKLPPYLSIALGAGDARCSR